MKINLPQLEQHLSQNLGKLYLVSSDEPFLVQEAQALIRQKAAAQGFAERLRADIENDADLQNLYTQAYTPPLLGGRRVIEVYFKGDKLSKAGQTFLQNYGATPSPYSILLVRLGKLDSKTEQTQWFKALEKHAVVIIIWPLQQKQLPAWIQQRARSAKLKITPEAAERLAQAVEGNLQAAAQEIEKLSLLGQETIDAETIENSVIDQGCFSAFDLVEQALSGNAPQVLRILRYLQSEGSEPLLILGAFTYELRTLAKMAKDLHKGSPLANLFNQYRVRLSKQEPVRNYFKRHTDQKLHNLFIKAAEIDHIVKGAHKGDVWMALEQLSLGVAGIADLAGTIYN